MKKYRISVEETKGERKGKRVLLWDEYTSKKKAQKFADEWNRVSGNPTAEVIEK